MPFGDCNKIILFPRIPLSTSEEGKSEDIIYAAHELGYFKSYCDRSDKKKKDTKAQKKKSQIKSISFSQDNRMNSVCVYNEVSLNIFEK